MPLRRRPLLLLLAAFAAIPSPPARAQTGGPPAELGAARVLAAEAMKLYDAGQYVRSTELFEKADAQYPSPTYRVYAARAYARGGKLRRAIARYTEATQMSPPPGAPPSFVEAQRT